MFLNVLMTPSSQSCCCTIASNGAPALPQPRAPKQNMPVPNSIHDIISRSLAAYLFIPCEPSAGSSDKIPVIVRKSCPTKEVYSNRVKRNTRVNPLTMHGSIEYAIGLF
jgi:hypothetical protein